MKEEMGPTATDGRATPVAPHHTPGPWEFEQRAGDEWWFGDGDEVVIRSAIGNKWEAVAVMGLYERGLADARLIAAAPDLAEALDWLLACLDATDAERLYLAKAAARTTLRNALTDGGEAVKASPPDDATRSEGIA